MSQADIAQTVAAMAGIKTTTLGWDVVVSYGEAEINKLLASDFKSRDTKQIKDIECQVSGVDPEGDPYTIDFKFQLSARLISFSKTRTTAVCNLAAPVVGGYGKTTRKNLPIKNGVYTLHIKTLELATASGDNNSYTPPNQSFIFPRDNGSDGFVVIDLRTSEHLTIDITAPDNLAADDYNKFVRAHKASICEKLKTKLRTDFRNVRYELARVKSNRPVAGMVQLVPRSFRFAAYEPDPRPGSTAKPGTVLSLFIQTRDNDSGEKNHLDEEWSRQWHTALKRSPIPTGQTASIIFNKDMIFESVMKPAFSKQGFIGKMSDTVGNITLNIDTKKKVKRDKSVDTQSGVWTEKRTISAIDATPPELTLKFYHSQGESTIYCSRAWEYEYAFDWWFDLTGPGTSVHNSGRVTATHDLKNNNVTSFKSILDDYSVKMECSVDQGMWQVELKPSSPSFWERIAGGTGVTPQWVKDLNIKLPNFTVDLGSFDFFLTTNLLLPSRTRAVIQVDKTVGLKIPGDLYIVGKVATS